MRKREERPKKKAPPSTEPSTKELNEEEKSVDIEINVQQKG